MGKSCHETDDLLWAYSAGVLDAADTQRVDAHLNTCCECRERAHIAAATQGAVYELRNRETPRSETGWSDLCTRLHSEQRVRLQQRRQYIYPVGMALAIACSVGIAMITTRHVSRGMLLGPMDVATLQDREDAEPALALRPHIGRRQEQTSAGVSARSPGLSGDDEPDSTSVDAMQTIALPDDSAPVRRGIQSAKRSPLAEKPLHAYTLARPHDRLGVEARSSENRIPTTNYVLDSVPATDTPRPPTNYVMGSIPAPQAVSDQDGQGRSETL